LGINLAPDVESNEPVQNESEIIIRKQQIIHQQQAIQQKIQLHQVQMQIEIENQQHQNHDPLYKKKYAKEAWPGRKSINTDLVPGLTSSVVGSVSKLVDTDSKEKTSQKLARTTPSLAPNRLLI